MKYKPFGEVRYTWKNSDPEIIPSAYALTRYSYTGQYAYTDDPSTPESEGFGLMFFQERWYDPALGRFTQPDSIVPKGVQGYDRYAYANNSPIRYNDPSGHCPLCITAAIGAAVGAVIGAASVAVPQMVKNVQAGQPLMANINPTEVGKAAVVGAVAGGVAGLTMGIGTAMLGTGLGASMVAGAGSGVVSGQVARATSNAVNGNPVTEGLGNSGDMMKDAALGAAGGAVAYGAGRVLGSAAGTVDDAATEIHGNSLNSPKKTVLYEITNTETGAHLKYGITSESNPLNRYTKSFLSDKTMTILDEGTRREMHLLENQMILNNPRGELQLCNH